MKTRNCFVMIALAAAALLASCNDDEKNRPVAVTGVELSASTLSLLVGTDTTLTATVLPLDAADTLVAWISGDPEIVSVDAGKVSALKAGGPVAITVTTNEGGFSATCNVTVTLPPETFVGPEDVTVSTVCGNTLIGTANGALDVARFAVPYAIAVASPELIFVGDNLNHRIQRVDVPGNNVSTLAGPPPAIMFLMAPAGYVNATGGDARFSNPIALALDAAGNLYAADNENCAIRKITQAGVVTTFAGGEPKEPGFADAAGTAARFNEPSGIAVDKDGYVYVADGKNYRVRKISPAGSVSTLAGSGVQGAADGAGSDAQFQELHGLEVDAEGNVYVADDSRVRKISPAGVVTTLAGGTEKGYAEGAGTAARFDIIMDIAIDAEGYLYVTDLENNCIRRITPSGVVTTLAGTGSEGTTDGLGTEAMFNAPGGIDIDANGTLFVVELSSNRVRKITFNN